MRWGDGDGAGLLPPLLLLQLLLLQLLLSLLLPHLLLLLKHLCIACVNTFLKSLRNKIHMLRYRINLAQSFSFP